jgi:hypothetical protein
VAQTGCIKQNQINCLKIDIAIDFGEKGAKRFATVTVEANGHRWHQTGRPGKGFLAKATDSLNELDAGLRGFLGAIRLFWYLKIYFGVQNGFF